MLMNGTDDELLLGPPSDKAWRLREELCAAWDGTQESPLRKRMREDIYFFAREVVGNQDIFPEKLEGDFKRLFDHQWGLGTEFNRGQLNAPRNTYKTSGACARFVHMIANDRNIRILYLTNRYENAVKACSSVAAQLAANELLIEAYGPFKPKKTVDARTRWTSDTLYVTGRTTNAKEPTFTAGSVGQEFTGNHYDVIWVDDAVDAENSRTGEGLRKVIEHFKTLTKLIDKKSRYEMNGLPGLLMNQGTRYADADLHGWLLGETDMESPAAGYAPLVLRSMQNPESWKADEQKFVEPKLNFPFVLTQAVLTEERQTGRQWFYTQFQNECVDPEGATFRVRDFKLIRPVQMPPDLRYYVLTDYAHSIQDDADRTAIWVVGLNWERIAYCVDFNVGRWRLDERAARTVLLAERYQALAISVEKIPNNEGVLSELYRLIDLRRVRARVEEINRLSSQIPKERRIQGLQPRFEAGRIFFVTWDERMQMGIRSEHIHLTRSGKPAGTIVDEFVRFPRAPHDDIPDALADIDARDRKTGHHMFSGGPRTLTPAQAVSGLMMVNGRIRGVPTLSQMFPTQKQQPDFWTEAARAARNPHARAFGR